VVEAMVACLAILVTIAAGKSLPVLRAVAGWSTVVLMRRTDVARRPR
jgi:hypothetical protein